MAARVVPNVPTFAVDHGFWYSVPDHLIPDLEVGRLVRVPLGGRKVRGWVVEVAPRSSARLKEISGYSGDLPVFDHKLLKTLIWAANHYVAPLPVLLARATPPNLPRLLPFSKLELGGKSGVTHPLGALANSVAQGKRRPTQALLGRWHNLEWVDALIPVVSSGRSVAVIAASAAEVTRIGEEARSGFGPALVQVAAETDAELTTDWEAAQHPGRLVVGTPRVATWHIAGLGLAVVLEEGRRAMKDRQTPTLHVREVMRTRALIEGFTNVFFGPTPSVEILAAGADVTMLGNRAWPLVEVIDRSEEAPGSGQLATPVISALRAMVEAGERSFVFTSRRMAEQTVSEVNSRLGAPVAAIGHPSAPVIVGTERDLAALDPVSLTVAVNPDGMLMASGHRTEEETLRQLARLANVLRQGPGHRMMVQTFDAHSELVATLKKGDPVPFLERVLVDRARSGVPPSTEMIALEIRDHIPDNVEESLRDLPGASVMGPVVVDKGRRWLLEGDLRIARVALRELVGRWRNAGATVRIDADPIDL